MSLEGHDPAAPTLADYLRRLCGAIMLSLSALVILLAGLEYLTYTYPTCPLARWLLSPPPASAYTGLCFRLLPYGLILLALGTALLVLLAALRRNVITPTLDLQAYLQQACHQQEPMAPVIPPMWHPMLAIISQCFNEHRITLRKRQADQAFKNAVVDNSMLAVISMNQQGQITAFNRAAEQMFGFNAVDIIGQDLADMIIPERYRAAHRTGVLRYLITGQTKAIGAHLELNALHADGHELPIELTIFVTPVDDNLSYTAFIADHSQRKRIEEQVTQQREALLQSEKLSAMGALLAGVAHELNNPLAILMGRAALLEDKAKDPAIRADAERIRVAADRCGRIVKTFLSMARQKPVERKWSSLNEVATGAADLLDYSLRSGGISVLLELDHSLAAVEMDADKIGQVLVNLMVNAQQALAGATKARTLLLQTGIADDFQYLRLVDNGAGVPEHIQGRIFEPFFTTKVEGIGTGIGLSVSRAILREHGGELVLENTRNGASFVMTLPIREPKYPIGFDRTPQADTEGQHEGTVLIVDDEQEVALVLADILRSAGYAVYIANSGNDALCWLAEHTCNLLFSDVRMPDMDGITLWRTLRTRYPEVVKHMALITGDTLSASIAPLLAETGLPYLEKPFLPEEVLQLAVRIETPRQTN
ncbi:response regulator [Methylovulum psychrotolerans]|uniref:response regulator n=1 Tax=Methylovulum psychrotolerans TaxID=1704499 RepID=UPI001BFF152F|nr:response regulator [Methylovulum psychrotolerans]MBT9098134.1 response regulator [Methylovulum psychrotolerans]